MCMSIEHAYTDDAKYRLFCCVYHHIGTELQSHEVRKQNKNDHKMYIVPQPQ